MPESDLLLAGAPARHELTHGSSGEEGYWPREPLPKSSSRSHRKARTSKAVAAAKPSAQDVLRSFNSWSFKREQPAELHLMLQCIARAMASAKPVPFVLYWGKGPRSTLAPADTQCLDFIQKLADRVAEAHDPGASITLVLTDTHARLNGYSQSSVGAYFAAIDGAARQRGFSTCRLSKVVAEHRATMAHEKNTDPIEHGTLAALTASARKWYRGVGSPEEGARKYYRMNLREKRAVEKAFAHSIFITFNGSTLRSLFPDGLPIFRASRCDAAAGTSGLLSRGGGAWNGSACPRLTGESGGKS
jgi:L-tyrosine isonitrile synthase